MNMGDLLMRLAQRIPALRPLANMQAITKAHVEGGGIRIVTDPTSPHDRDVAIAVHNGLVRMRIALLCLAAFLAVVAALVVVFAPAGRETGANIIALALFVVAAGIAGFTFFKLKVPLVEVQAGTAAEPGAPRRDNRKG